MEAHISNYQHLSFWKKLSFPNLGKWIESNCYFSCCTLNYHSNSLWVRFILHSFEPFSCRKISILPVFSLWFCRTKKHTNSRSSFWICLFPLMFVVVVDVYGPSLLTLHGYPDTLKVQIRSILPQVHERWCPGMIITFWVKKIWVLILALPNTKCAHLGKLLTFLCLTFLNY